MFVLQTLGAVDLPGLGPRKMPAPRAYVAIIVTWAGLDLLADTGRARAASVVGWVLVLTSLVAGPNGRTLTSFLGTVANLYQTRNVTGQVPGSAGADLTAKFNQTLSA
jgi:hypothetical protein